MLKRVATFFISKKIGEGGIGQICSGEPTSAGYQISGGADGGGVGSAGCEQYRRT